MLPHSLTHTPQKRPVLPAMSQHLEIQMRRILSRIQYGGHTFTSIHSRFNEFLTGLIKEGNRVFWTLYICMGTPLIGVYGSLSVGLHSTMALLRCTAALSNNSAQCSRMSSCSWALSSPSLLSSEEESSTWSTRKKKHRGLFSLWCCCCCLKHPSKLRLTVALLFACSQIIPKRRGSSLWGKLVFRGQLLFWVPPEKNAREGQGETQRV